MSTQLRFKRIHRRQADLRVLLTVVACCPGFAAHAGNDAARTHDLVPEDYFTLAYISSCKISPDGKHVAYTESRWEKDHDGRNTDLWVVRADTRETRRLTFGPASEQSIQWSPDGTYVYFASNQERTGEEHPPYDGKRQVWRISPAGGEMQAITRIKDGIASYELSRDGKTLYYATTTEEFDEEWKDLRKEYKDLEYGHGVTNFSQIWKLDLTSWRSEKLVDEKRVVRSFRVSPDQSRIAMYTTPDATLLTAEGWSRIDVYDTTSKEVYTVTEDGWRKNHPSPYGWLDSVAWSGDGKSLAFTVSFDGYPPRLYIVEFADSGHKLLEWQRAGDVSITGGTVGWRGDTNDVCYLGEHHARSRVYCIAREGRGAQGERQVITEGDVTVSSYDFTPTGELAAVVTGGLDHAGDLFLVRAPGQLDRITKVNPQIDTWKLPQISLVQWKGADGDTVEGVLELPPDYDKSEGPIPMVVEIHGGPTAASWYRFRLWIYGRGLMAAKGYALLSPNYHGSTGYGDEFMTKLIGRENEIEVQDIIAGVDAMVERGIADPDSLAVMGWSNGGYLTNCLITHTDRFKVASSGAGVLDMVIQWGTEDTPGHVINFVEGLPWSNTGAYLKASPIYNLHRVKTPTIIHVGEHDERVPAAHARALYRGLRHYIDVPTELIVYPGAGHGLTTYEHRMAKMKWDHAWFDKYLTRETEPAPEPKRPEATN